MSEGQPVTKENAHDALASTLGLVVIWLFGLTFAFQNMLIPSSSMASTLLTGDHVLVEHVTLAPPARWAPFLPYREIKRGDIIVFYKPVVEMDGEQLTLVKRVIAIPGDRIHLRNGIVYLNGVAQAEPQIKKQTYADYNAYVDEFPLVPPSTDAGVTAEWAERLPQFVQGDDLVVPAGKYFAMGDNRNRSLDSRYWGFVPRENIVGRPIFVYWSIRTPETGTEVVPVTQKAKTDLHEFLHFFDETRWGRTLHRIQ